ncbi:MAG: Dual specificity protein phosphatase [Bacteroidetes bacterium]|nr:MAG: Dual specificity protein phosphatase [Bacteroidota bacterium]
MKILFKISVSIVFLSLMTACQVQNPVLTVRPELWAKKVELNGFENLYKVDNDIYRSEQPGSPEMKILDSLGIRTVVNLRQFRNDDHEAKNTGLLLKHFKMNAADISYDDIVSGMDLLLKSEKPVLVHCLHGSDRTGCLVAVYRMVKCGWTREEAIEEFLNGGFGYHKSLFPGILNQLKIIDIEALKKDIGMLE